MGPTAPNPKRYSDTIPYDFCPVVLGRLQLLPFREELDLDARNEATARLGLSMTLHVRKSTTTVWNHFFKQIGHEALLRGRKRPPKIQCFRGNLLCRETKTQAYAKPLHAKSLNTFFFKILAWQLQGTIHSESGDATTSPGPSPAPLNAVKPVSLRRGQNRR